MERRSPFSEQLSKKVKSFADKAVQLADFIAGSVREKYENDNDEYLITIEEKISIAHET